MVAAGGGFGEAPKPSTTCPCGSKVVYKECCEPFHAGKAKPSSAAAMLRSRFSAYSKSKIDYLLSTDRRPRETDQLKRDLTAACKSTEFSYLKVLEEEPPSGSSQASLMLIATEPQDGEIPSTQQVIKFQYSSKSVAKKSKVWPPVDDVDRNIDGVSLPSSCSFIASLNILNGHCCRLGQSSYHHRAQQVRPGRGRNVDPDRVRSAQGVAAIDASLLKELCYAPRVNNARCDT